MLVDCQQHRPVSRQRRTSVVSHYDREQKPLTNGQLVQILTRHEPAVVRAQRKIRRRRRRCVLVVPVHQEVAQPCVGSRVRVAGDDAQDAILGSCATTHVKSAADTVIAAVCRWNNDDWMIVVDILYSHCYVDNGTQYPGCSTSSIALFVLSDHREL